MTPTLLGRIETRLALLAMVGVPLTLIVAGLLSDLSLGRGLLVLVVIAVLGVGWETLYHAAQQLRRDKDWPSILALVAVLPEAGLAWSALGGLGLQPSSLAAYAVHFGAVWTAIWLMMQGPLRVLAPQWRFDGMRFDLRPSPSPTPPSARPSRAANRPGRPWSGHDVAAGPGAPARRSAAQLAAVTTAVALGMAVTGIWLLDQTFDGGTPAPAAAPERTTTKAAKQPAKKAPAAQEVRRVWDIKRRVNPTTLALPKLGLRTGLTRLGLTPSGTVETPTGATQAGWYERGAAPGQKGPAVVIGQVSGTDAIFADVGGLARGAEIVVGRQDGTSVSFRVDRVQRVGFADFPTQEVYGPTTRPTLRVIGFRPATASKGGENVILYATAQSVTLKPTVR